MVKLFQGSPLLLWREHGADFGSAYTADAAAPRSLPARYLLFVAMNRFDAMVEHGACVIIRASRFARFSARIVYPRRSA